MEPDTTVPAASNPQPASTTEAQPMDAFGNPIAPPVSGIDPSAPIAADGVNVAPVSPSGTATADQTGLGNHNPANDPQASETPAPATPAPVPSVFPDPTTSPVADPQVDGDGNPVVSDTGVGIAPTAPQASDTSAIDPNVNQDQLAAKQAVDIARADGVDVPKDVQPGMNTATEVINNDITPHEADINTDNNPNVTSAVEQAHRWAEISQEFIPAATKPEGAQVVSAEPQFENQMSQFQSGNGNFQQLLTSAVTAAVQFLYEDDNQSKAEYYMHPSRVIGLPFPVKITVERSDV